MTLQKDPDDRPDYKELTEFDIFKEYSDEAILSRGRDCLEDKKFELNKFVKIILERIYLWFFFLFIFLVSPRVLKNGNRKKTPPNHLIIQILQTPPQKPINQTHQKRRLRLLHF